MSKRKDVVLWTHQNADEILTAEEFLNIEENEATSGGLTLEEIVEITSPNEDV